MKNKKLHPYQTPDSEVFEVAGSEPVLTSVLDALAIDSVIGSIDEVTFTDFDESF